MIALNWGEILIPTTPTKSLMLHLQYYPSLLWLQKEKKIHNWCQKQVKTNKNLGQWKIGRGQERVSFCVHASCERRKRTSLLSGRTADDKTPSNLMTFLLELDPFFILSFLFFFFKWWLARSDRESAGGCSVCCSPHAVKDSEPDDW
jgi:hypothetical protein